MKFEDYKIHPLALKVPAPSAADYSLLKKSIQENGQQFPIMSSEGEIIDGKTRLKICCEFGIEPHIEEYTGSLPVAQYILTTNIRRNLTKAQRHQMLADFAEVIIPQVRAEMKERKKSKAGRTDFVERKTAQPNAGRKAIMAATGASTEEVIDLVTIHRDAPEVLKEVAKHGSLRKAAAEARRRAGKPSLEKTPQPKDTKPKVQWTHEQEAEDKACLEIINAPSTFPSDAPVPKSPNNSEAHLRGAINWLRKHEGKIASFKEKDLNDLLLRTNAIQAYKVNWPGYARPDGELDERIIDWAQDLWLRKERQHRRLVLQQKLRPARKPRQRQSLTENTQASFDDRFKTFWMLVEDSLGLFRPGESTRLIKAFRIELKQFFSNLSGENRGAAVVVDAQKSVEPENS